MKKPSYIRYKRYERGEDLIEWLLRTRPKFRRGVPGRRNRSRDWVTPVKTTKAGWIHHVSLAIYQAWYGDGLNYEICDQIGRAFREPTNQNRKTSQALTLARIKIAMDKGFLDIFKFMDEHLDAVKNAPASPLEVAVGLAFFELKKNWKQEKAPNPARWVEESEKMFEETRSEKQMMSLRASLFRTMRGFLKRIDLERP